MRVLIRFFSIALIISAFFVSCATMTRRPGQPDIKRIVGAVNRGDAQMLSETSAVPFLLDGEMLSIDADVSRLWLNLTEAGFKFGNAAIVAINEIGEDGYKLFADSMEVKVFFAKYVERSAVLAEVDTEAGKFLLLVSPAKNGKAMIRGMKGPVS